MNDRFHASQPSLFRATPYGEYAPPPAAPQPLSAASSLAAAMQAYHAYLAGSSYSAHTVKAFIHDVALLAGFLGIGRPIGEVGDRCLSLQRLSDQAAPRGPCSRRVPALPDSLRAT